jgi:hypothetical protein
MEGEIMRDPVILATCSDCGDVRLGRAGVCVFASSGGDWFAFRCPTCRGIDVRRCDEARSLLLRSIEVSVVDVSTSADLGPIGLHEVVTFSQRLDDEDFLAALAE